MQKCNISGKKNGNNIFTASIERRTETERRLADQQQTAFGQQTKDDPHKKNPKNGENEK